MVSSRRVGVFLVFWSRGGRELVGFALVWLVLLLENKRFAIFISDFGAFFARNPNCIHPT